jgi:hypothetical protein
MDAFLEDGSHEATIAVIRALVIAVPHTIERLRDYILKLYFWKKMFGQVINVPTFLSHFSSHLYVMLAFKVSEIVFLFL